MGATLERLTCALVVPGWASLVECADGPSSSSRSSVARLDLLLASLDQPTSSPRPLSAPCVSLSLQVGLFTQLATSLATSWVVSMTAALTWSTTLQISSTRSLSALPSGRLPRTRAFPHEVIPWMELIEPRLAGSFRARWWIPLHRAIGLESCSSSPIQSFSSGSELLCEQLSYFVGCLIL